MSADDLYERLMEARDLLWEATVRIRQLERKPEPQAEVETWVETSDEMNLVEVHRILEQP